MSYPSRRFLCSFFLFHFAFILIAQDQSKYPVPKASEIEQIYATYSYEWIGKFREGLALARLGNDYLVINHLGEKQFDFNYQEKKLSFKEDLALVKANALYGFIDRKGREITPMQFNYADYLQDSIIRCELEGKKRNL